MNIRVVQLKACVVALVGSLLVGACGGKGSTANPSNQDSRLRIVTTVAPITSIVANIAGDLAIINGVVPEGTNSHTFDPPPSTAKVISKADVIFVNGLKLEDPTRELAENNKRDSAEIVELGNRTLPERDYIYDFSFPKDGGKPNPHLWTNPPMAKEYARIVAEVLQRRDPRHAAQFLANYTLFAARIDELDAAMRRASNTIPRDERQLLTYHDAYAYFAKHYDWNVVGAIQVSSFEDPTPREVADLIRQIRRLKVKAIFGSEVFPSPVLKQIGKETGVKYVDVLRDDDLPGKPGDRDHSWLGLMLFDYITMVESLGGDATSLKSVSTSDTAPDTASYPQ